MITHHVFESVDLPAEIHFSLFSHQDGPIELNIMATANMPSALKQQLHVLEQAYARVLAHVGSDRSSAVFRRVFCSDPANQYAELQTSPLLDEDAAVSLVGQAPVGPAKVAFWAYHLLDSVPNEVSRYPNTFVLHRGPLAHHWTTRLTDTSAADPYTQSDRLMRRYVSDIGQHQMTLLSHVVRTWFMVRDVDNNYQGLVDARRSLFDEENLTPDTHYIASTGIEALNPDTKALVYLDSLAIEGLQPEQVQYLQALQLLSPTHIYGVTFERGTAIHYRDRSHLYISGTASIDAQGNILHEGDVMLQLERTLENIEALLAEANGTAKDMSHWIIYLRDDSDEARIRARMRHHYGDAPMLFVHAPVCRPGWLIEIEGIAVVRGERPTLPAF